jgi:hypothetical protein
MTDGSYSVQYTCCCHDTSLAANKIIRSVLWALWGVWRVQRCLLLIAKSLNALTLHTNDVKSYTLRSYTPPTIYSCLWMWMCLIDHLIVRTMCTFNYDSLQDHTIVLCLRHTTCLFNRSRYKSIDSLFAFDLIKIKDILFERFCLWVVVTFWQIGRFPSMSNALVCHNWSLKHNTN